MVDEAFEDRELFLRCPSCEGGAPRPACEECGGSGFIAVGLTTGALSRLMDQVEEMYRVVGSIHRAVRWGLDRGRDDRGGDGG
jgi:hypothetical protein